jgi:hypothetical protein
MEFNKRPFFIVVIALVAGFAVWHYWQLSVRAQGPLVVNSSLLSFDLVDNNPITTVSRSRGPELWFRVLLSEAPLGVRQSLRYEWINPTGSVVKENNYKTKVIDRLPWETHARLRLDENAPKGFWRVKLFRDMETLREMEFEVTD